MKNLDAVLAVMIDSINTSGFTSDMNDTIARIARDAHVSGDNESEQMAYGLLFNIPTSSVQDIEYDAYHPVNTSLATVLNNIYIKNGDLYVGDSEKSDFLHSAFEFLKDHILEWNPDKGSFLAFVKIYIGRTHGEFAAGKGRGKNHIPGYIEKCHENAHYRTDKATGKTVIESLKPVYETKVISHHEDTKTVNIYDTIGTVDDYSEIEGLDNDNSKVTIYLLKFCTKFEVEVKISHNALNDARKKGAQDYINCFNEIADDFNEAHAATIDDVDRVIGRVEKRIQRCKDIIKMKAMEEHLITT